VQCAQTSFPQVRYLGGVLLLLAPAVGFAASRATHPADTKPGEP
jgi:hypothetical protein